MSAIQEKVVLITGASGGIGEAAARLLARRGAKVVLGARRTDRLEALANDIPSALDIERLDFLMLKYTAVGETLAAALLTESRRRASDPLLRALFTSIVSDEVHHARLGWYYVQYRAERWSPAERLRLAGKVAEFMAGIEQDFAHGSDASPAAAAAAKALGLLDSATQCQAVADVMNEEIVPALDNLGLSGSAAWAERRRASAA